MDNNHSRFILEESNDEFQFSKNKSNIDIKFNRVAFIFFVFFVISLIYSIHLVHLGSRKSDIKISKQSKLTNLIKRADIIDINGTFLAKTVSSIDIGINPIEIIDKKKLLLNLKYIFPNKNYDLIKSNIEKKKFFWFEKKISEENYEKLMKLGDKSIKPEEKIRRLYPQKNLFSHIIGRIDDDNIGISGLEKSLDEQLKNNDTPIQLSVDKDIQFLIREELLKYNEIFKTLGSAAILMNVNNGEIISIVSLPDFDLNQRNTITDVNYINRATKGVYELGSVFKTFTIASGLNEGLIESNTKFLDSKKIIYCDNNKPIREYDDKMPSDLTVEQILIRSGNIGAVRIARKIGIEKHKSFLKKIGILDQIEFDIEEVGIPRPLNWNEGCKLETISYGHGITTTILQLVNAYSIIANGGYQIHPTLIKTNRNLKRERLLKKDVSNKITPILRKIVTTKEGTASLANVEGYEVGGKTGTAQKSAVGGYSRDKINTFASIFPISKPKYSLVVMLDEPKINSEYIYHYRDGSGIKYKGTPFNTAGWTSVEVAGQIIEKIGPILATKYKEIN